MKDLAFAKEMIGGIPNLMKKLAGELVSTDITHDINRPVLLVIGYLLTHNQELGTDLMYDDHF